MVGDRIELLINAIYELAPVDERENSTKREMGFVAPSTNHRVLFNYRLR